MIEKYLIERKDIVSKQIEKLNVKIEHNSIVLEENTKKIKELEYIDDEAANIFSVIVRKEEFSVNTLDGIKKVKINLKGEEIDTIKVNMGNGSFLCEDIPAISNKKVFIGENIDVLDKNFEVNAMLMGVSHVVILVDDISIEEVCKYGPLLEKNKNFLNMLLYKLIIWTK